MLHFLNFFFKSNKNKHKTIVKIMRLTKTTDVLKPSSYLDCVIRT